MLLMSRPAFVLAGALLLAAGSAQADLKVQGSSTVTPVVAEAAEELRAARGLAITVDPAGGSSGGIAALGDGRVDVAMSSRPLNDGDHARYPSVDFRPVRLGSDAVALVVSRDVWEGGVRSLSRYEMRGIYEGRIRRWSELGGPDRRIAFFNKEPGRGTWEVFAAWLYGDADAAPLVSFPEVGANAEARNKVADTPGALSQLSAAWADGERVFALAIEGDDGTAVAPSRDAVASGRYPVARPLYVLTAGPPGGEARLLIDFLLGPRGQALVEKNGYLPLATAATVAP